MTIPFPENFPENVPDIATSQECYFSSMKDNPILNLPFEANRHTAQHSTLEGSRCVIRKYQDFYIPNIFSTALTKSRNFPFWLKVEGLNDAGSIKIKPAISMISALEAQGLLKRGGRLIESSSGNLGVALSMVCAARGYQFTCVTDPVCSRTTCSQMQATGAEVITVTEKDAKGGYLGTRIDLIKDMLKEDDELIWTNQYANKFNPYAHYETTAPEIYRTFPRVDWLFVGAGTCGTLMGCLRYFREISPSTRVVAVDTTGSTTFGGAA